MLLSAQSLFGMTYQWLLSGNNIAGKITNAFTTNVEGNYSLRTTCNGSPAISNVVAVKVKQLSTFYSDSDDDDYGNLSNHVRACWVPVGFVADSTDCNDTNATVHPNAIEICWNDIDNDCDGVIDEGCPFSLDIKLYIEGFYLGNGNMMAVSDPGNFPTVFDTVVVTLQDVNAPNNIAHSVTGTIGTNGNGSFIFPGTARGNTYYIVIRYRNALETWSKNPVMFNTSYVNFDLTSP